MMDEKKSIVNKKNGVIVLIIAFLASLGVNITNIGQDQGYLPYGCAQEDKDDMFCYKLSRVGTTGVNRFCYYDRDKSSKYKVCNAGWELMTSAIEPSIIEAPTCPKVEEKECPAVNVLAYMPDGTKYWCDEPGPDQICERADDMMLPI